MEIYKRIRGFLDGMSKENLSTFSSSAAFYLFLSLVPILIVICTVIPFTPLTQENLIVFVTDLTPDKMDAMAISIIDDVYNRSAGVLSLAAIVTLWSAGKGVLAVIRGLNAVNEVEEKRNYFLLRIVSSFYTLIMLVCVLLSMILLLFGNRLVKMIEERVPGLEIFFSFLMNLRFLFVWFLLTLVFSAFYAYLPDKKLKFRKQLPGASIAAVLWSIFSWGFSIYIDYGNSFSIYGSLSIIVIFMMWLYFCIYILFWGAYSNKWMEDEENAGHLFS